LEKGVDRAHDVAVNAMVRISRQVTQRDWFHEEKVVGHVINADFRTRIVAALFGEIKGDGAIRSEVDGDNLGWAVSRQGKGRDNNK
jgi:hypothetical protein